MATIDFDPPVSVPLQDPWSLCATEHTRSTKDGDKTTVVLLEAQASGAVEARLLEEFSLKTSESRRSKVDVFAATTGLDATLIDAALIQLYGQILAKLKHPQAPALGEPYYADDAQGFWLVKPSANGEQRIQLTNFTAKILVDIVEDDGTSAHARFFEIEATQGELLGTLRLPAKEVQSMLWIPEVLGPKARVYPGKYFKEHAHAAMQDLSPDTEQRHTYTHTGWREIEGEWCYLHGAGAITAQGVRKDLSVALGAKFERYRLPVPPSGPEAQEALRASLALRTLGPDHLMLYPLSCAYLAPLRQLLIATPPDFVLWIVGRTGSHKSEYAALTLTHFGDFTRLTLPMTFETTGNGLERILHTPKDSLLVIDDYHPADSRQEADTMAQVASRLLRGMGNMTSRQRMRRDTTMQDELPPRCLALATGELVPNGHSNNARMFLVSVPPLNAEEIRTYGEALTKPQQSRALYAQAMTTYIQWIAQQWSTLAKELPQRHAVLRQEAAESGCHAREPGQVAYLQLAWETFTQCAVDHEAIRGIH
jgi:hypothetical protein